MTHKQIITWLFSLIAAGVLFAHDVQATENPVEKHLLYVTVPDMAGGLRHWPAIYIYDIDDGHKLVKTIEIPSMGPTRGICASATNGLMFITYANTSILAFDLVREQVVWSNFYRAEEGGCDRPCVTPDGKKVYVPEGWWNKKGTKCMKVLDGATGELLKNIPVGINGSHVTVMTLDGKRVYLGPVGNDNLVVIDTEKDEVIKKFGGFGEAGPKGRCSPLTINGAETLCFANSHDVGFYVADLKEGKILNWVQVDGAKGYSHGVSLTPDETEIWLMNPKDKRVHVYDATKMPPVWKQSIDISAETHGWVAFSLDSRYAWCDTGDVIDPATKKIVATLKDENGDPIRSAKFIEIHLRDGKPIHIGNPTAIGCKVTN